MLKVFIIVEGRTEKTFADRLLAPDLAHKGICVQPVILTTRTLPAGEKIRGGLPPYPRIRREVLALLGDSSATCVTSMLDFYGLRSDFPGKTAAGRVGVQDVEAAWKNDIGDNRFLPYLSMHEFEALLFTDPEILAREMGKPGYVEELSAIRHEFATPEDINDRRETAPSWRLRRLFPDFEKPLHGPQIASRIGLRRLRAECPHFNNWVTRLELMTA